MKYRLKRALPVCRLPGYDYMSGEGQEREYDEFEHVSLPICCDDLICPTNDQHHWVGGDGFLRESGRRLECMRWFCRLFLGSSNANAKQ